MRLPHALLSCVVFAASLSAQTTWIVDANNGPGTSFTEIQPAVDAASAGDVILVRPGTYQPFSASKGVAILGQPGFVVMNGPLLGSHVTVHDLPFGETFVLANATIAPFLFPSSGPWISILDAPGRVHLRNVLFSPQLQTFLAGPAGLVVANSSDVTVSECVFPRLLQSSFGVFLPTGFDPAVSVSSSDLTLVGCTIEGRDGGSFAVPFQGHVAVLDGEGLVAMGSTVHLSRSDATGGSGVGMPAIVATGSSLTITGAATNVVHAGVSFGTPIPAISADSTSTVLLDAQLSVQGSGGGPALSGGATLVQRRVVSLDANGGTLGGSLTVDAVSAPDDICVLLLGIPYAPTPSPIGTLRINLATAVLLAQQVVPATGVTQATINIPNAVALRGLLLGFQAANWDHTTGQIEVSNVADVVLQ